ncbi:hypothetical protein AB0J38_27790 [Streptomyces sp. NPDC050095]|uniref:hypothetical protein n=1 Tax=unclassified Streptomyces TaxID=2593676 RepID=UPI00343D95C2
MKRNAIDRRAQKLTWATGLPWTTARKRVGAMAPNETLIAEATPEQALLECHFLHAIARPTFTTVRPWGIETVDGSSDRLIVHFEDHHQHRGDRAESTVHGLVRAVLPHGGEPGDVHGLPGARLGVEDGVVVLRRIGLDAAIQLDGFALADWQAAVDAVTQEVRHCGMAPCQEESPADWHAAERAYLRNPTNAWYENLLATSAWLPSGLLRRVPLLRTIGVPLGTTAWTDADPDGPGELWKVDQEHVAVKNGVSHHRPFVALLTDPEAGMPLTVEEASCRCGTGRCDDCRVYLRGTGHRPGRLEIRSTRRQGLWLETAQQDAQTWGLRQRLFRAVPTKVSSGLEVGASA